MNPKPPLAFCLIAYRVADFKLCCRMKFPVKGGRIWKAIDGSVILLFPYTLGCDESKTCFGIPSNCIQGGGCQVVLSYEISGEGDGYLFKMAGKSDGYLAVGLSPDNDKMGDDLTTACYYDQNGNVSCRSIFFNIGCLE